MLRAASKPVDRAARQRRCQPALHVPPDAYLRNVDGDVDAMTMTSRLGSCRLHFFLIPAKTCRISALLLRGFQM